MKRLYLFCDQGMSTSLLASRMQVCADKHMLPIEVNAFSYKKMQSIVEEKHPVFHPLPNQDFLFRRVLPAFDQIPSILSFYNSPRFLFCSRSNAFFNTFSPSIIP